MVSDTLFPCLSGFIGKPAVAVALTLVTFVAAQDLQKRYPQNALLNPTLISIAVVVALLAVTGTDYETYLRGTQVINFMLAPTVVLLAVPLYRRLHVVRQAWPIIAGALAVGLPTGFLSVVVLAYLCDAKPETLLSLIPKSVTSGVAVGISETIGGIPALTAIFVIMTGIVGAVLGPLVVRALRIDDDRVLGLAMGVGAHGIGTAKAFQISETAGAFASLAMALNGVLTAMILPVALSILGPRF